MFSVALIYFLSGFLMKISDDFLDLKNNTLLAVFSGILSMACIGYLAVTYSDATTIFLAILLGTLLSGKVDRLGHLVSLLFFLGILAIFGIPTIGVMSLAICIMAAWLDEIGNDSKILKKNKFRGKKAIEFFLQYRPALKISVFLLAFLGGLPVVYSGLNFFQPITFIYFMLFDLAYEIAGLRFDNIYNGLQSIFRIFRKVYAPSYN
jgi:hypothetical protein